MTVNLIALSGPFTGRHFSLPTPLRIGSSPECELCIPGPKVAPIHATIDRYGPHGGYVVEAHALLYVDTRAVRRMELASMCQIDLGESTLLFEGGTAHIQAPGRVEEWLGAPPLMARSPLVPVATLEMVRMTPALVGLDAQRVLVVGGVSPLGSMVLDTAELVDISTGKSTVIQLCEARKAPVALRLSDGRVFIAGGGQFGAEMLTPEGSEPCKAHARVARQGAHASELADGRVLIVGGYPAGLSWSSMEIYDPERDLFETLEAPEFQFAKVAQAGSVLLISAPKPAPSRLFSFDLRTLELRRLPPLPLVEGLDALSDGSFLLRARSKGVRHASFRFDPTTRTMSSAAPYLAERCDFVAASTEDGRLLVAGGSSTTNGGNSAELYDPARDEWEALPALRRALGGTGLASTTLPQGPVVIVDRDQLLTFDAHWAERVPLPVAPPTPVFVKSLADFQRGPAQSYAEILANLEGFGQFRSNRKEDFPTRPITDAEVVEVLAQGLKSRTLRAALKCAEALSHAEALPELATPPLLEALAHPAEFVRRDAAISLRAFAPLSAAAVSTVMVRLRSESESYVNAAMVELLVLHVSQRSGPVHQALTSILTHLAHGVPAPVRSAAKNNWRFAEHGQQLSQSAEYEGHTGDVIKALERLAAHPPDFPYLVLLLDSTHYRLRRLAETLLEQLTDDSTMREAIIEGLRPLVARYDEKDLDRQRVARLASILDKIEATELVTQIAESNEDPDTVIHALTLLSARDDDNGEIARALDRLQATHSASTKVGRAVRIVRTKRGLSVTDDRVGVPLADRLLLYRPLDVPIASPDMLVWRDRVFATVMQGESLRGGLSLSEARCGVVMIDPERELACRSFLLPLRFPAGNTGAKGARRSWKIAAVTSEGLLFQLDQPFSRDGFWGTEQYLYEWSLKSRGWRRWRRVADAWSKDELSPQETEETPTNRVSVGELRVWQEAPGGEVFANVDSTPTFLEDAVSPDAAVTAARSQDAFRGKTFVSGKPSSGTLAWEIYGLPPLLDAEAAVRANEGRAEPGAKVVMLTSLGYRTRSGAFLWLAFCRSGATHDGVALLR